MMLPASTGMIRLMDRQELTNWLEGLIVQAQVNRQPWWHLRAAKAGLRGKQPRLIDYERQQTKKQA